MLLSPVQKGALVSVWRQQLDIPKTHSHFGVSVRRVTGEALIEKGFAIKAPCYKRLNGVSIRLTEKGELFATTGKVL